MTKHAMNALVSVSRIALHLGPKECAREIDEEIDRARSKLTKPPYGKRWEVVEGPYRYGFGVGGGALFKVMFDLTEDESARVNFKKSNRRRWASHKARV